MTKPKLQIRPKKLVTIEPTKFPEFGLYLTKIDYLDMADLYRQELTNLRLKILNKENALEKAVRKYIQKCKRIKPSEADGSSYEENYSCSAGHLFITMIDNKKEDNRSHEEKCHSLENKRIECKEDYVRLYNRDFCFSGHIEPEEGWLDDEPFLEFEFHSCKPKKIKIYLKSKYLGIVDLERGYHF